MKKLFTIVALALMTLGANAQTKVLVKDIDFTKVAEYPYYKPSTPEGSSYDVKDGALVIENNVEQEQVYSLQPFVLDQFSLDKGANYVVEIDMEATAAGGYWLGMGKWGDGNTMAKYGLSFAAGRQTLEVEFNDCTEGASTDANDAHILFQCGKFVGTIKIYKVTLYVLEENTEANHMLQVSNGDAGTYGYERQAVCTLATPMETGKSYVVSVTIMSENGGECQLVPIWSTSENKDEWGGSKDVQYLGVVTLGPAFKRYSWYFDATFDHDKLQFFIGKIAGNVYFENVSCKLNTGGAAEMIANVDFEGGDVSNWSVLGYNGQTMKRIEKVETRTITVGATGYATFYSPEVSVSLDVEGITAYSVKLSGDKTTATLTPVTEAGQYTAVLIKAAAGTYELPVIKSAAWFSTDLKGHWADKESDGTQYCLAQKNGVVGFYKVQSGVKIPTGKGFLEIPAASRDFVGFDFGGETTGIEKASVAIDANAPVYNLNGQRVAQPTRGLYIVNGKKVIIK